MTQKGTLILPQRSGLNTGIRNTAPEKLLWNVLQNTDKVGQRQNT